MLLLNPLYEFSRKITSQLKLPTDLKVQSLSERINARRQLEKFSADLNAKFQIAAEIYARFWWIKTPEIDRLLTQSIQNAWIAVSLIGETHVQYFADKRDRAEFSEASDELRRRRERGIGNPLDEEAQRLFNIRSQNYVDSLKYFPVFRAISADVSAVQKGNLDLQEFNARHRYLGALRLTETELRDTKSYLEKLKAENYKAIRAGYNLLSPTEKARIAQAQEYYDKTVKPAVVGYLKDGNQDSFFRKISQRPTSEQQQALRNFFQQKIPTSPRSSESRGIIHARITVANLILNGQSVPEEALTKLQLSDSEARLFRQGGNRPALQRWTQSEARKGGFFQLSADEIMRLASFAPNKQINALYVPPIDVSVPNGYYAETLQLKRKKLKASELADYWIDKQALEKLKSGFASYYENNDFRNYANQAGTTEVYAAYSAGQLTEYIRQGYTRVRWNALNEQNTCPYCRQQDGKVFEIEDIVSDPYLKIPAHRACRCWWTPVEKGRNRVAVAYANLDPNVKAALMGGAITASLLAAVFVAAKLRAKPRRAIQSLQQIPDQVDANVASVIREQLETPIQNLTPQQKDEVLDFIQQNQTDRAGLIRYINRLEGDIADLTPAQNLYEQFKDEPTYRLFNERTSALLRQKFDIDRLNVRTSALQAQGAQTLTRLNEAISELNTPNSELSLIRQKLLNNETLTASEYGRALQVKKALNQRTRLIDQIGIEQTDLRLASTELQNIFDRDEVLRQMQIDTGLDIAAAKPFQDVRLNLNNLRTTFNSLDDQRIPGISALNDLKTARISRSLTPGELAVANVQLGEALRQLSSEQALLKLQRARQLAVSEAARLSRFKPFSSVDDVNAFKARLDAAQTQIRQVRNEIDPIIEGLMESGVLEDLAYKQLPPSVRERVTELKSVLDRMQTEQTKLMQRSLQMNEQYALRLQNFKEQFPNVNLY